MSDVFISYARSTETAARTTGDALRAAGYSVWRDDDLPTHRAYADVIEEQLRTAKAVVVVWSADAVKSHWVRSEADFARTQGKLVQLTVDGARLPMPFDQIQCANLAGWQGAPDHPGWRKVLASVADLIGVATDPGSHRARSHPASIQPLLAVLAFDNLSGDPEMDYFSDGVSEEIRETVARGSELKVVGRGSSFQFRGANKAAAHVAAEVQATHVLDGAVRRAGAKVRISTELVDCASQTRLWSQRFDRDLSDIFALQDEIAAAVATALKTAFAAPAQPPSVDPGAYDLYLRARTFSEGSMQPERHVRAMGMLEEVTAAAPGFARAWGALAMKRAWCLRVIDPARRPPVTRADVEAAAATALRLDPGLGVAYQALGLLEPFGHYQKREALCDQALAAAPDDPEVLLHRAMLSAEVGRTAEALGYAERAVRLDRLFMPAANWRCAMLMGMGRYDEVRPLWDEALARWPEVESVLGNAIGAAAHHGETERLKMLAEMAERRGFDSTPFRDWVEFHLNLADPSPEYLTRFLAYGRDAVSKTDMAPLAVLTGLVGLGLVDEAFELAETASFAALFDPEGTPAGATYSPGIIFHHSTRAMIRDIRFMDLCRKLGFCDYWAATERWPDCVDATPYDFRAEARKRAGATLDP